MNEILQQRIKEAAQQYIQSDAVAPENMQLAFGDFIEGAKWVLQNQWISVEEGLPEEHGVYFVLINSKVSRITTFTDKWDIGNNTYNITHWMPIPKMKEE